MYVKYVICVWISYILVNDKIITPSKFLLLFFFLWLRHVTLLTCFVFQTNKFN